MNVDRPNRVMDSSLHSESKFKSDFSIERILSEDAERVQQDEASPSWLCCTRYRPPRLARTASNASRARRSGRHARVPFTAGQAAALEAAYKRAPYLAPPALRALAAALQLRDDRIKIWFQNRRARERREKSGTITPPQAVILPPTSPPDPAKLLVPINTPWNTFQRTQLNKTQSLIEADHCVREAQKYTMRPTEISILGSHTPLNLEDQRLEDRCDSPVDVET